VKQTFDKQGWKRIKFGEVCRNLNIAERDPLSNGIDRFVGLEHIEPENLHLKSWGNIADGITFSKRFKPGQVLFGKRRSYQKKVAFAEFDGICSSDILVLEANEKRIEPSLFPFLLQSERFLEHAVNTSAGALSPRTKFQDLAQFEFLLPPKEQQAKIAELLWAADNATQKAISLVNGLGELLKLSSDLIFETYTKKPTINNVRNLDGYQECPVTDLLSTKLLNGIYKSKEYLGHGIKLVNMGELFAYPKLYNPDMQRITLSDKEEKQFLLQKGDLLFARRSLVIEGAGKCSIVMTDEEKMTFESSIIRLRLNTKLILPMYCHYFFRSSEGVKRIKRIVGYTTVAGITGSDLYNISVPVIEKKEQEKCVENLGRIEELITEAKNHVTKTENVIKNLIHKVF